MSWARSPSRSGYWPTSSSSSATSSALAPRARSLSMRSWSASSRSSSSRSISGWAQRLVGELGQGRPAPERESFAQHPVRRRRAGGPRIRHELLEAIEVERTGIGTELVRRRRGPDHVATEHPPELGDVRLENLRGRRRRPAGPELLDQQVARNRLVRPDEQQGKQGPLLWRIQRNDAALGDHLKRPEDAELHAAHARGRARCAQPQAPLALYLAPVPAACRRSTVAQPVARTILGIGETTHGSELE